MWKRSMISASIDVMGPYIGTDEKIMNIIKETYKTIHQSLTVDINAVVTGKSPYNGGLDFGNLAAVTVLPEPSNSLTKTYQTQFFLKLSLKSQMGK